MIHRSRVLGLQMLLFLWMNSGESQSLETVGGSVGGHVLLPCSSSEAPASASVYWRDEDGETVLDIRNRTDNHGYQNQKYRGRVTSSSNEFQTGNFSVTLSNLQRNDTGVYECYIKTVQHRTKVKLTVSERTPPSGGAAGLHLLQHLLQVLLLFSFSQL